MSAHDATAAPRPPLLTRLHPRHRSYLDLAVGVSYGALAGAVEGARPAAPLLAIAVGVLTGSAIWLTRGRPVVGLAVALAAAMLAPLDSGVGWLTLAPVGYALWRIAVDRGAAYAAGATGVGMSAPVATALPDFRHAGGVLPFGVVLVTCTAVGLAVGAQRRYSAQVQRHQEERTAMAVADGRQALLEERLKLARELHDVVAHTLSIVTVQAAYGHLVFDDRPVQARQALAAIETAGREASQEMRRLLDVLRDGNTDLSPVTAPSAGVTDLARLVEQASTAGVGVTVELVGQPRPVPAGVDLTAYRIVQEALTNVVRHADTTAAQVTVTYGADALSVRVSDRGRGRPDGASEGHGLLGMRERVELYGGRFAAGNRSDGVGFVVEAELPLLSTAPTFAVPAVSA